MLGDELVGFATDFHAERLAACLKLVESGATNGD